MRRTMGALAAALVLGAILPAAAFARWHTVSDTGYEDLRICTDAGRIIVADTPYEPAFEPPPPPSSDIHSYPMVATSPPFDTFDPNSSSALPIPKDQIVFDGRQHRLRLIYDPHQPSDPFDTRIFAYSGRFELVWKRQLTPTDPNVDGDENLQFDFRPASIDDALTPIDVTNCRLGRTLNIKPADPTNSIDPNATGTVKVAVKSSGFLDATSIDVTTVRFGPNRAAPVSSGFSDVDGDGDVDATFRFRIPDLGLSCSAIRAFLELRTTTGHFYDLSDSVSPRC
ncbi:hypothetical protein BH18ACT15_BH18ACT15_03060 [soil metagenome]